MPGAAQAQDRLHRGRAQLVPVSAPAPAAAETSRGPDRVAEASVLGRTYVFIVTRSGRPGPGASRVRSEIRTLQDRVAESRAISQMELKNAASYHASADCVIDNQNDDRSRDCY